MIPPPRGLDGRPPIDLTAAVRSITSARRSLLDGHRPLAAMLLAQGIAHLGRPLAGSGASATPVAPTLQIVRNLEETAEALALWTIGQPPPWSLEAYAVNLRRARFALGFAA